MNEPVLAGTPQDVSGDRRSGGAPAADELPAAEVGPPDLVVAYGSGPDQVVDVRLPPTSPPHPGVVVVHGGFWRAAYDRAHVAPMCAALTSSGFLTAAVEYKRVGQPGGGWPGTLLDVAAAIDALPGLLEPVAPIRSLVLVGHSAGGQLVLWAATRNRQPPDRAPAGFARLEPDPLLQGAVALAPVADLVAAWRLGLSRGAVVELIGGDPSTYPDRYAAVDPAQLPARPVPTVLLHGRDDESVPVTLSRRLAALDPGIDLRELPATGHFALIDPTSEAWPLVVDAVRSLSLST